MTTSALLLAGLLVLVVVIIICSTVLLVNGKPTNGLTPLAAFALGLIASLAMRKGEDHP